MDGKSLNITEDKLQQLRALFPEVFTEGKVDFTRLRDVLGDNVNVNNEHYELSWAGKTEARKEIQKQTTATLVPDRENSVDFDTAENLFIEGENLEVIRVLQKSYYGKVKMIYIDPPYNTGNDSFVYPDDYSERQDEYKKRTGITDEDGNLNKQDLWRKNSKENGQFHSVWLSMMYPRLFLARNLLKHDGVIFVSIDDNEQANLKLLMDEIFGEENFVANVVWQKKYSPQNDAKWFSDNHDHILVYAKNKQIWRPNLLERTQKAKERYKNPDNDPKGPWKLITLHAKSGNNNEFEYSFKNGYKWTPPSGTFPRYAYETLRRFEEEGRIWFGKDGKNVPSVKNYLSEVKKGVTPLTVWTYDTVGHTHEAKNDVKEVFDGLNAFETPKPIRLLKQILKIGSNSGDIVLDFFSGSASTAHAVIDLNMEDGGNRKYIMVQMPEPLEKGNEGFKAGYKHIADISRARIEKVIEKIKERDVEIKQNMGFKAYKLSSSNFKMWQSNIQDADAIKTQLEVFTQSEKEGSGYESMLYELLLKTGFLLTAQLEEIVEGVYSVNSNKMLFCFVFYSNKLAKLILEKKPEKVVLLNSCFEQDKDLTNFKLQLKDNNIDLTII